MPRRHERRMVDLSLSSAFEEPGRVPWVIAHRGSSSAAPENTLSAVRRAVAEGADLVEVDVQRTRDGALVVFHDATLERTTDACVVLGDRAPAALAEVTFDQLRQLDAGSWKDPGYAGERVPLLEEVLDVLVGSGVGLQLEVKHPRSHPGMVEEIAELLQRHRLFTVPALAHRRLVVQSFDVDAMAEHKMTLPDVPVGILGRPTPRELTSLGRWAKQINPHHLRLDRRYVDRVRDAGLQCLTWTVDHPGEHRRVMRAGVDGIITNRPAELRDMLLRLRSPVAYSPVAHEASREATGIRTARSHARV